MSISNIGAPTDQGYRRRIIYRADDKTKYSLFLFLQESFTLQDDQKMALPFLPRFAALSAGVGTTK